MIERVDMSITGDFVEIAGDTYYRISNYDAMPPFFITVVSSDNHWLYIATTGGLSAGRINADHALFPYYTVDRITENADNTGSRTILTVSRGDEVAIWEPFIPRHYCPYDVTRNLYKNITGTALIFEEINHDLALRFRYAWRPASDSGIVKTAWLHNQGPSAVSVTITDGLQNILPAHVDAMTQNRLSVLLDAYKRSELDPETGTGIYSLSSRLTDLAEPAESLRATTVWQTGLDADVYLLSSLQLDTVRAGQSPVLETDVRGQRGAYFVHAMVSLTEDQEHRWHLVAEVNQDTAAVSDLMRWLQTTPDTATVVEQDIMDTDARLRRITGQADAFQVSGSPVSTAHHVANVLFNVMRGGIFVGTHACPIDKADLLAYIAVHDHNLRQRHTAFFDDLPDSIPVDMLRERANAQADADLIRLCYTYLPLTFSRRHGDPSRPWNHFSIDLRNEDGSPRLNYEGNWRDIFQNWEALAYSYPAYLEGMIAVFLNATTIDGYNPYRIMRDGIDWEIPEPDNPWANIGYWSDHQIIYLQKLLEACERFYPGTLHDYLNRPVFAFANVPYRIKRYSEIVQDPYHTIDFDWESENTIQALVEARGTDAKLLMDADGAIVHVNLTEKLLNLLLAKLVNFVPDGGIWMITQRPEWNDANNALVGKGLSVVTTCYLRRFVVFFRELLADAPDELMLSESLHGLFETVHTILKQYQSMSQPITDQQRRSIIDELGRAGSDYRWQCYEHGLSGETVTINSADLQAFLEMTQTILEQTIRANERADALYHAYNTLQLDDKTAEIQYLPVMLEGQVAVLSSGLLDPNAVLALLRALRESDLYRADQHSYMLYPDRELPGFVVKNTLEAEQVNDLKLVETLIERNDPRLMVRDDTGDYHFGGELRNAKDLDALLKKLTKQDDLADLVTAESNAIHRLFESVFEHSQFTGRSGSFFAYEGLGSIYWHMISKLLLAVQENVYRAAAMQHEAVPALIEAYDDIRAGLNFNKSPEVYGAFPLDAYSHTPRDRGAKQPGMTGMVKEEILTRPGELGIVFASGKIIFDPVLLREEEWLETDAELQYRDVYNETQTLHVPAGAFALTLCQVPVIVRQSGHNQFEIQTQDETGYTIDGHQLDAETSQHIFARDGVIRQITIHITPNQA